MNRRSFIGSILALGAAPSIVRASSLMKINPRPAATFDMRNALIRHYLGSEFMSGAGYARLLNHLGETLSQSERFSLSLSNGVVMLDEMLTFPTVNTTDTVAGIEYVFGQRVIERRLENPITMCNGDTISICSGRLLEFD